MVARAVDGLRRTGVARINFDLIYGLPHQTEETLRASIGTAAAMRPHRVALCGYAHVPWMAKKRRLIDETTLPGTDARARQAISAAAAFAALGYQAIGLDHFAPPDDSMAADGLLTRSGPPITQRRSPQAVPRGRRGVRHLSRGRAGATLRGGVEERRTFFFAKKNQKTFNPWCGA